MSFFLSRFLFLAERRSRSGFCQPPSCRPPAFWPRREWPCSCCLSSIPVHARQPVADSNAVRRFAEPDDAVAGRRYVRYFNHEYQRSGTLWEGRYKSCLVQEEGYLLEVYRYIEFNPVRAGMVADPGDYRWSSYQVNALGHRSGLCTPHPAFLALGVNAEERRKNYRALFERHVEGELLAKIRENTNKGLALATHRFKEEIEALTGRRVKAKKRGRPWVAEGEGLILL